ncbi:hypothetical protein Taro_003056 [Colocasia esculenta]|uniref:Uncharacterized protein n=1 Tax=Colocasia esculenta TaxID=4460 RepID=A0A843TMK5_COLES|nr:hypothetical protein [Colocasia esculenta]
MEYEDWEDQSCGHEWQWIDVGEKEGGDGIIEDEVWVRGIGCLKVGGAGGAVEEDEGEEGIGVTRVEVSGALVAATGSFPFA